MPYMRGDEEMYDELAEELGDSVDLGPRPTGEFEFVEMAEIAYEPSGWNPASLPPAVGKMLDILRRVGVTQFRVRYDGGHDEGFSHADSVTAADGSSMQIESLVEKLASPQFAAELRAAALASPETSQWYNAAEYYSKLSDLEVVKTVCDELAEHIVVANIGQGYGTGEYSMYGEIVAELVTGTFTDDRDAKRPPDSTFE